MNASELCHTERRRQQTRRSDLNGLDYLEVSPDQRTLTVYFLGKAPTQITAANVWIDGGRRVRDLRVLAIQVHRAADPASDDWMGVTADQPGDFSTYTLRLQNDPGNPEDHLLDGFDPRYAKLEFSFKAGCPSDLDCQPEGQCPPKERLEPEISYLAKDYASFRQLILDRLALLMPDWQERHVPDLGITLVELLAYVGDHLSYYQDAVATEAYLGTARQRISVRRHARLVDYVLHEGCNARAWVTIDTDRDVSDAGIKLGDVYFTAGGEGDAGAVFEPLAAGPDVPLRLHKAHGTLRFYTWGDEECCLPRGATSATLTDAWAEPAAQSPTSQKPGCDQPGHRKGDKPPPRERKRELDLNPGDVLIFEEVVGPRTGNPSDANPTRRWAVRLTRVTRLEDPVVRTKDDQPTPVVEIEWAAEDALPFAFCLSARLPAPDCRLIGDISVARGNVILVDHGQTIVSPEESDPVGIRTVVGRCACEGSAAEMTILPDRFVSTLKRVPLTFSERLPKVPPRPTSGLLTQDPRKALPRIDLKSIPPAPDGSTSLFVLRDLQDPRPLAKRLRASTDSAAQPLRAALSATSLDALGQADGEATSPTAALEELRRELKSRLEPWTAQRDLLGSGSTDRDFVVEVDNEGQAHLRFGDGLLGQQPAAGTRFLATYRVGNGPAGNVGADTITNVSFRKLPERPVALRPRNPLPAQGGIAAEPMAEARLFAPGAFRNALQRAITPDDYARLAERNGKIQRAGGALRWTGSWYEAHVAVDPRGAEAADERLIRQIKGHLFRYRRMGHDLSVAPARYVPLEVELTVCVLPGFLRGHVEAALLDVFSNRVLPDGRRGFFHPDQLTFGDGICLSQLVAKARAVTGVGTVKVTRLRRLFEADQGELDAGILDPDPLEIVRLDNDPSFPEHGTLKLNLRGGQ